MAWPGEGGESAVVTALGRLDGEARLVLALLFVEGLSEAEAAAALDRSVEHVSALARTAQRALAASAAGMPHVRAA
ncbi:MAG: sigma factor-like helix-turn-helix DNA-binding protein [Candidatus Eisenbacteria bacterium]